MIGADKAAAPSSVPCAAPASGGLGELACHCGMAGLSVAQIRKRDVLGVSSKWPDLDARMSAVPCWLFVRLVPVLLNACIDWCGLMG